MLRPRDVASTATVVSWDRVPYGGTLNKMNMLNAIRREERKLEKQLGKLQGQWDGLRSAAKVLGNSAG